jgi:hypothetical protein
MPRYLGSNEGSDGHSTRRLAHRLPLAVGSRVVKSER